MIVLIVPWTVSLADGVIPPPVSVVFSILNVFLRVRIVRMLRDIAIAVLKTEGVHVVDGIVLHISVEIAPSNKA